VREALKLALINKAPKEDKNPNRILKLITNLLAPFFTLLFNKLIDIKYYPAKFKVLIIVALKKLGKDNYSQPKLYRLIALINIIEKILDTILIQRI
jgi:hypothetical protein